MPRIVSDGTYDIYVYAGDHPPPHCHVFWAGDKQALVDLRSLKVIAGDALPRAGAALVQAHLNVLLAAWQRLNP